MRHDPAAAAIVIMLRSLKMYGMGQAVEDLIEQGAPRDDAKPLIADGGHFTELGSSAWQPANPPACRSAPPTAWFLPGPECMRGGAARRFASDRQFHRGSQAEST